MLIDLNFQKFFDDVPPEATILALREIFLANQQSLIICKDQQRAEELAEQVSFYIPEITIQIFTNWDTLPFELVSPSKDVSGHRLAALNKIRKNNSQVTIATIAGVVQKSLPQKFLEKLSFAINLKKPFDYQLLVKKLAAAGYSKTSIVQSLGDFALRGSVIDFFAPDYTQPLRIEFSNEDITRIRFFDVDSQRTTDTAQDVYISPVRESLNLKFIEDKLLIENFLSNLESRAEELELAPSYRQAVFAALANGENIPAQELLSATGLQGFEALLHYFPKEQAIIIDNPEELTSALEELYAHLEDRYQRQKVEKFILPHYSEVFLSLEGITSVLQQSKLFASSPKTTKNFHSTTSSQTNYKSTPELDFNKLAVRISPQQRYDFFSKQIHDWREQGYKICFTVNTPERANLLRNKLLEKNFDCLLNLEQSFSEYRQIKNKSPLTIILGSITHGLKFEAEKFILVSENESLASHSFRRGKHRKNNYKKLLGTLNNLNSGDFVVHEDYGIALYQGLKQMKVEGVISEFIQLDYADSKLFLPVQSIGRIQKYSGNQDQEPQLDKLSSKKWQTSKQRIKKEVLELAGDLIKLYALRSINKGYSYSPENHDDQSFSEDFPYDETEDQLTAIQDSLQDLAREKPMDRLICGDVGFGKTEVAMRAAFKAVQHGKQVAVLAPTTVLVEQHRASFEKRFANFPVRIGALSRFYSHNSNKSTLELLGKGKLDIIIGTHALLQKNTAFNELGLVIIDEEHRFGVKQKEFLKKLRTQVDILTLTATPIPRTLHLSLLGIRDISVISTAPQQRQFVKTYIANFDEHIIKDAITRELQRGGQVFFLHNRVQSIESIAHQLRELLPEIRIAIAHGQMKPSMLERIMHSFIKHEIDVLVSTTIIESGLDIPNANTIIINRADMLGLSQLYQLRGRVGRSSRQAYCYLLVPKINQLTPTAHERLKALEELDDLGRGFNLALRDLEIRGAGNLLGQEQSGNVSTIGYDLYVKILQEAIYNLRGQDLELEQIIDPEIKLDVSAFIPDWYIPDISERLVLYQRMSSLASDLDAQELRVEIADRYGDIPIEALNLLMMMVFRAQLKKYGVLKFEQKANIVRISFDNKAPLDLELLIQKIKNQPKQLKLSGTTLIYSLNDSQLKIDEVFYSHFGGLLEDLYLKK